MIWSKLKRVLDELQADSLRGRWAFHITRYGPDFSTLIGYRPTTQKRVSRSFFVADC